MAKIIAVSAKQIFDSRNIPTLETTLTLDTGVSVKASVPSGTSKGSHEALENRDHELSLYDGLGVSKAISIINTEIAKIIIGIDPADQREIDEALISADGTSNKGNFGSNTVLSVSLACARAAAAVANLPLFQYIRENLTTDTSDNFSLPHIMANIVEGGIHSKMGPSFQEFLLVGENDLSPKDEIEKITSIFHKLKDHLDKKGIDYHFGLEGGFDIPEESNEKILELLWEKVFQKNSYKNSFKLGIDIAAGNFFKNDLYLLSKNAPLFNIKKYNQYLLDMLDKYQIYSLEDPFFEDDFNSWSAFRETVRGKTLLIGDDLTTTNTDRLHLVLKSKSIDGVIIKPNQIGTLSETISFAREAEKNNLKTIISHRSGETEDDFIVDLAVALNSNFLKIGVPHQRERLSKYTRLSKIYDLIGGGSN